MIMPLDLSYSHPMDPKLSWDKMIQVWDASAGVEILPALQGHDNGIVSVAFLPDGSKIVSGSWDKMI
jgi:WD40 repeat protein